MTDRTPNLIRLGGPAPAPTYVNRDYPLDRIKQTLDIDRRGQHGKLSADTGGIRFNVGSRNPENGEVEHIPSVTGLHLTTLESGDYGWIQFRKRPNIGGPFQLVLTARDKPETEETVLNVFECALSEPVATAEGFACRLLKP